MNLNELTIISAAKGLKNKEFSSTELTQAVFNQIKKIEKDINAFLSLNEEEALRLAEEIDHRRNKGDELGELAGVPLAIKDNILVKGLKCTAGSKILANFIAPYDATVIKKLKQAGAIIIGKTNLDEFAMGGSTEASAFKITKNPCDLQRVPGGSSGGSAAAVAANEAIAALGSDTGGSIRQPASFCGVVGLKPTYGAVSRFGLIAMASSLDQIGPITKTVGDAKILFEAIKGKDPFDSTSVESKITQNSNIPPFQKIKIGVPKEYFAQGIDQEVEKSVWEAIEKMRSMGAQIKEISLPNAQYALACYYIIMPCEASANLARYDGIKYGEVVKSQSMVSNLLEGYLKTRQQGFGVEVRRRIMLGTYALSAGYYDAYYLKAQKVRALIKNDFEKAFKEVDLIVGPTSPTPAFKIGEKINDPIKMYLADIYTVSVNLAGLPALSLPCKKISNLPVGLQIIGPYFGEEKIFQAASKLEAAL